MQSPNDPELYIPLGIYDDPPPDAPGFSAVEINDTNAARAAQFVTARYKDAYRVYDYLWP